MCVFSILSPPPCQTEWKLSVGASETQDISLFCSGDCIWMWVCSRAEQKSPVKSILQIYPVSLELIYSNYESPPSFVKIVKEIIPKKVFDHPLPKHGRRISGLCGLLIHPTKLANPPFQVPMLSYPKGIPTISSCWLKVIEVLFQGSLFPLWIYREKAGSDSWQQLLTLPFASSNASISLQICLCGWQ